MSMETMMMAATANDGGGRKVSSRELQQNDQQQNQQQFQMPLHYPRYRREEYEAMAEWQLDRLLADYGLPVAGSLHHKRNFAIGAFLWAGQQQPVLHI